MLDDPELRALTDSLSACCVHTGWLRTQLQPVVHGESERLDIASLRWVDGGRAELARLPAKLADLDGLKTLILSGLAHPESAATQKLPSYACIASLETLHLANCCLTDLPDKVAALSALTELLLLRNRFERLPVVCTELQSLRKLDLSYNAISDLPAHLNWPRLTDLNLSSNPLQRVPAAIGTLVSLERCVWLRHSRDWAL